MSKRAIPASSPTACYDRAVWICAAAILIAAVLTLALPGKPKPQRHASSDEQIARLMALVDA